MIFILSGVLASISTLFALNEKIALIFSVCIVICVAIHCVGTYLCEKERTKRQFWKAYISLTQKNKEGEFLKDIISEMVTAEKNMPPPPKTSTKQSNVIDMNAILQKKLMEFANSEEDTEEEPEAVQKKNGTNDTVTVEEIMALLEKISQMLEKKK